MQGAAVAPAADFDLSGLRRGHGRCGTHVEIGQEIIVERIDAGQQGLDDFHW